MKLGKHWVDHVAKSKKPETWISAVIEIPARSASKYRLDKVTGQLELARMLAPEIVFPMNYGFIPHTRSSADDEEVDIMVLTREPLLPLTILKVNLIGGFTEHSFDEKKPEDRMIAIACEDPSVAKLTDIDDLDHARREQIETFVRTYKQDEGIEVTFEGWFDRKTALDKLARGFQRAKKRAAK